MTNEPLLTHPLDFEVLPLALGQGVRGSGEQRPGMLDRQVNPGDFLRGKPKLLWNCLGFRGCRPAKNLTHR